MNLANKLTLLRILLVPIFIGALVYYSPERAHLAAVSFGVFLLACLTDAVDGAVARRLHQQTVVGSYIDPIADKLLLLSGFFCLSYLTNLPPTMHIPAWVTIAVVSRDVVILGGSAVIFLTTGELKAEPLFIGKSTTVLQMLTLAGALLSWPPSAQTVLYALTLSFTIASGVQYIRMGGRLVQAGPK